MRKAGRAVAAALKEMKNSVRAGMTTAELDGIGADVLGRHGARSGPRLVYNFPGTCCISVNDEAVHGVPGDRILEPEDVVKIDVTAELDGYFADAALTVALEPVRPEVAALTEAARRAFYQGIEQARAGRALRDWGRAVESHVRRSGFSVLEELFSHGVGGSVHEAPRNVPNYNEPKIKGRFQEGTTVALEPIISQMPTGVVTNPDGWTIRAANGSLTAHFEHTVLITRSKPIILTAA